MGLERIDAGPGGGGIDFSQQPNVDPLAVIKLVQSEPEQYRFDGGAKLKFTATLDDTEKRISFIENLLHSLRPENTTT